MCLIGYLRSLYVFWTIVLCCEKSVLRRLIRQKCHFLGGHEKLSDSMGSQEMKEGIMEMFTGYRIRQVSADFCVASVIMSPIIEQKVR